MWPRTPADRSFLPRGRRVRRTATIIFPDTNLFLHFRDPAELDWSAVTPDDDIRLVVGRTVQKEIQKKRFELRGRAQDRARSYAKLLGDLAASQSCRVVRESGPRVELHYVARPVGWVAPPDLDKAWGDDQLVADALAYRSQNDGVEVAVLSDDGEVISTAYAHNVGVLRAPDDWELPSEAAADQREIMRLTREVADLKRKGPNLVCLFKHDGVDVGPYLSLPVRRRDPLTDAEIDAVLLRATQAKPIAVDFSRLASGETADPDAYDPVIDETIAAYCGAYGRWARELRKDIEDRGQRASLVHFRVGFEVIIENTGVEPAQNMHVLIQAPPGMELYEPAEYERTELQPAPFKDPPRPPQPRRKRRPGDGISLNDLKDIEDYSDPTERKARASASAALYRDPFGDPYRSLERSEAFLQSSLARMPVIAPARRDPQRFYRAMLEENLRGGDYWDYECESFPHQGDSEIFEFDLLAMLAEGGTLRGEIAVRVTADNLRAPLRKSLLLNLEVEREDAAAHVVGLLELEP